MNDNAEPGRADEGPACGHIRQHTMDSDKERSRDMTGFTVDALEEVYPLADFIADALGGMAEVLVHNVDNLESSIVHIRNGQLSGRHVGDGTTDQALKLIKTSRASESEYVSGYKGTAGSHRFRSSTYFIKNRNGILIGLLCINVDITGFAETMNTLGALLPVVGESGGILPNTGFEENLQGDLTETIRRITRKAVSKVGIRPDRMSRKERREIIRDLQSEGVFLMKGAVNIIAPELGCSAPTLYRYLQEINKED